MIRKSGNRFSEEIMLKKEKLFHYPQQRGTAAALARRAGIPRGGGRFLIRHDGIAQLFQFQVRNAVAFHPVLENGHRHEMRGLDIPALDEGCPALFEQCKDRGRSFF